MSVASHRQRVVLKQLTRESVGISRSDLFLIHQRFMNRAHVSNLEHAVSLGFGNVALDRDETLNLIDQSLLVFASLAVVGMDSIVQELDFDFINF